MIPPLSLEYDCCDSMSKSFKLNRLRLHMPMEGAAGSFDDLKIANHKVGDVERLIFENDWKFKHFTVDSNMSSLSYVAMITTGLTLFCFCYCCSKCRCFKFSKWWKDNRPCTTIICTPRIVASIQSPRGNVRDSELVAEIDGLRPKLQSLLNLFKY